MTNKKPYDIPMIFSPALVKANLEGRKSQTRRMPTAILDKAYEAYQIGRPVRLWQREGFSPNYGDNGETVWLVDWDGSASDVVSKPKFKPSIHMPRKISRFTGLDIQIIKERIQSITEDDAKAEGLEYRMGWLPQWRGNDKLSWRSEFPIDAFHDLWDLLHIHPDKPGQSWDDNPEIYVLKYSGVNRNIDDE